MINLLPDETLRAIFDYAATRDLVSLTHVCFRWRDILLHYPRIWSDIHAYGRDPRMVDAQIKRCGNEPLLISIGMPWRFLNPRRRPRVRKNIEEVAKLIRKNRDQVTRLCVHLNCQAFREWIGCEWPNLKEFTWTDTCHEWTARGSGSRGGLLRIRDLYVKGGFCWSLKTFKHLTTLKLTGLVDVKLEDFTEILQRNTLLKDLELAYVNVRGSPNLNREGLIKLPHLKKLKIRDDDKTCGNAFVLLNLPSLESLSVRSLAGQSFSPHSPWSRFCRPLVITSLESEYRRVPSSREITVVGSNKLGTRCLHFKEHSLDMDVPTFFRSLSNPWLSSVTRFFFIRGMPDGVMAPGQISAICDLLTHLSRVEYMRLRPSQLAVEVVQRLRGDPKLCPRLGELQMTVSGTLQATVSVVEEMLKDRTGRGEHWEMVAKEPTSLPSGVKLKTPVVWKRVQLG